MPCDNNIIGSFSKWATAKARGSTSPARFGMIGDSNIAGQGSGTGANGLTGGWASSVGHLFAGLASYRTDSFFGEQNVTFSGAAVATYDPRMSLGSGWAPDTSTTNPIAGGRFLLAAGGSTGKLKFTPVSAFSKFRFWYPTASGLNGAVTVAVDGSTVDTLSENAASSISSKDYTVSSATHFIEIGGGATGSMYAAGVETFDGTSTPSFLQLGFCGLTSALLNNQSNQWNSYFGLVALQLDYVLIYCTINDSDAGTAKNTYYSNIEHVVAGMSATANGCLCVGYPPNNSNTTNGFLDEMATILRNIARDYSWSYYDFRGDLGHSNNRASALGYRFDDVHANAVGYTVMANSLYSFLSANGL